MKIYLGTDHAGFELKEKVKEFLTEKGYTVEDCGAYAYNKDDDYPDFVSKVGEAVSQNPEDRGIIFGGSGQGEAMLANKYPGVRAALFYSPRHPAGASDIQGRISSDPYEMIVLVRKHNDANVLSLGARLLSEEESLHAVELFLTTDFSGEERHKRRIEKMTIIEKQLLSS
jgi:ribose 5-phosphate isomerase B